MCLHGRVFSEEPGQTLHVRDVHCRKKWVWRLVHEPEISENHIRHCSREDPKRKGHQQTAFDCADSLSPSTEQDSCHHCHINSMTGKNAILCAPDRAIFLASCARCEPSFSESFALVPCIDVRSAVIKTLLSIRSLPIKDSELSRTPKMQRGFQFFGETVVDLLTCVSKLWAALLQFHGLSCSAFPTN